MTTFACILVLRSGEIFSLTAASGKSLSTLTWSALASKSKAKNGRKKFDEIGDEDEEQIVKKIRYLPPQTENNQSKYGGSFMVLLNTNNIVGLSPSGPHGVFVSLVTDLSEMDLILTF